MGFRENIEGPLSDALREYVKCAFDLSGLMPERPSTFAWEGEFPNWHLLRAGDQDVCDEALQEALSGIRVLSDEARLAVTPLLMLHRFPDSPDYGAPADQFLLLDDDLQWLSIYSPLQLACIAYYTLLPAAHGDLGRADLWRDGWWNLPLLVNSGVDSISIERLLIC